MRDSVIGDIIFMVIGIIGPEKIHVLSGMAYLVGAS
jgi:hypothetical protein